MWQFYLLMYFYVGACFAFVEIFSILFAVFWEKYPVGWVTALLILILTLIAWPIGIVIVLMQIFCPKICARIHNWADRKLKNEKSN